MKIKIDFSQPSTQRGVIWLLFGIAGIAFAWVGKDAGQLIPIFTAMMAAGAHGVVVDDDEAKK